MPTLCHMTTLIDPAWITGTGSWGMSTEAMGTQAEEEGCSLKEREERRSVSQTNRCFLQ